MITFYAAVGCYRVKNENGKKSVYIQKLGKLHPISIPEFAIWSSLLWEVMTYDELKAAYQEIMGQQTGPVPDFDQLLLLLSKRKLILSGLGYTGVDALYRSSLSRLRTPEGLVPSATSDERQTADVWRGSGSAQTAAHR